jgi:hypothetical protein
VVDIRLGNLEVVGESPACRGKTSTSFARWWPGPRSTGPPSFATRLGRALWLGRDFGGRPDGREVELHSSAIWTIRDGRVVEAVFYANRDDAFEAAGLSRIEAGERAPRPAS